MRQQNELILRESRFPQTWMLCHSLTDNFENVLRLKLNLELVVAHGNGRDM